MKISSKALRPVAYIAAMTLLTTPALAHEAPSGWRYNAWCCSGEDCQQIPDSAVTPEGDGWRVTLGPDTHRFATQVHSWHVPQRETRRSGDEHFHACLLPYNETLRCLYGPAIGF